MLRKLHRLAMTHPESRRALIPYLKSAVRTENEGWGFFGSLVMAGFTYKDAHSLFAVMGERLRALDPRLDDAKIVEALDSRWGRHLADWTGDDFTAMHDDDDRLLSNAQPREYLRAIKSGKLDGKIKRHLKSISRMGGPRLARHRPGLVDVGDGRMRKAYYTTSDGLSAIEYVVSTEPFKKDRDLQRLVTELGGSLTRLHKHLTAKYNWD
jgi:hypothetical protein